MFNRIGHRILAFVGIVVLLGLTWTTQTQLHRQVSTIRAQNERTMRLLTQSIDGMLESIMIPGDADIARDFATHLKGIQNVKEFQILRADGTEAFQDNKTIQDVNRRLGGQTFSPRSKEAVVPVLRPDMPELLQVLATGKEVSIYEMDPTSQEGMLTFLAPIQRTDMCLNCHGGEEKFRGLIRLTTSLAHVEQDVTQTRRESYAYFAIVLLLVLGTISLLVNRTVTQPVHSITQAMVNVANGDFSSKIAVQGKDELADMARVFNSMGDKIAQARHGLEMERNKLTTIILSAREGIVVTDPDGEIVLVNPSAERLLGKDVDEMKAGGFMHLLDDPEYMQALQDAATSDVPNIVVYNNKILNIYAARIESIDGKVIGSSALMRDVTTEKNLEEKLRKLATTDALTGLLNRRWFDEALDKEFQRSKRYGLRLALLFFDVDHFKRFNDEHGHDQGDRVLQEIAKVMTSVFRNVDHPCRYGGEEFCAILPNTGYPGGRQAADRLRQGVEEMVVDGLKVTISIGVAIYPEVGESPDSLLKLADNALYEAKRAGRNRVYYALSTGISSAPPSSL